MTNKTLPANQTLVPGANLEAYIATVNNISVLTAEQEQALAKDFIENENVESARQLVMAHLRYVVHIARSYSGYKLPQADIIQAGNLGLMKAVKRFEPAKGVRLVSFAVYWIKAEIHEFVLKNWRIVKVATTKAQRKLFFNLRAKTTQLKQKEAQRKSLDKDIVEIRQDLTWLSNAEAKLLAKDLGVSVEDVKEMESRMYGTDVAFSKSDDEEEDSFAPENYLTDDSYNQANDVENEQHSNNLSEKLQIALKALPERSLDIIKRRYLVDDDAKKATLQDLAAQYNVSAERVRQIEVEALKRLEKLMKAS